MIVHTMRGAYSGQWLLGDYLDDVAAQALAESEKAPSPTVAAGQPSYGGGGTPSLSDVGKYAGQAGSLISAGKDIVGKITSGSGGATPTTNAGITYVCKALYDKCKSFTTNATQQAKYKTLLAAQIASTAWKTYQQENAACGAKFTSGGFGKYVRGDATGNAAAYKLYQACQKAATDKYRTAIAKEKANVLWVATFREAANYVKTADMMRANGATIRDSKCTSAAEKNLMARVSSAAGITGSTYLIGALVLVGAGVAAWYVL